MKALCASLFTALIALLPVVASPADSDRTLQNVKGSVTYGPAGATTLAPKASTTLSDNDKAATGANSLATLTLPDSSQIEMGQNSTLTMQSFSQTDVAHAKFLVVGKMRFTVNHPAGAKADYQFSTSTGQIAVRGTVGDIFANPSGGLQVNVYALSNPALPVQVTLVNGQVFTLAAGQSLVATAAAGALTASVTGVSQSMFTPFSELGAPANAGSLGLTGTVGGVGAGAGATTGLVAGAVGAAAAGTAIVTSNNASSPSPSPSTTPTTAPSPTPTPTTAPTPTQSPTPQPSTTSVPITVTKASPAPVRTIPRPGSRPTAPPAD
jgi:hypothetical protein